MGCSFRRVPKRGKAEPQGEEHAGTPGTGEDICPTCDGDGTVDGAACANCEGTGKIVTGVGGA